MNDAIIKLLASEAKYTSRIHLEHRQTSQVVSLNSNYTLLMATHLTLYIVSQTNYNFHSMIILMAYAYVHF